MFRIGLGVYIACENDWNEGAFFAIVFSFFFLVFNIANLPFRNVRDNYRSVLIHITQFVVLYVTNYYRSMKSNTPMGTKAHIHTPVYIELSLISLCVVVSLGVAVYDVYRFVTKFMRKDKKIINNTNASEETMHN